jgi:hypothetical protein
MFYHIGETLRNNEKPLSGYSDSGPRIQIGNSGIQSPLTRNVRLKKSCQLQRLFAGRLYEKLKVTKRFSSILNEYSGILAGLGRPRCLAGITVGSLYYVRLSCLIIHTE